MATILSSDEITFFTGSLATHFDTFSYNRTKLVIVYKEPLKTVINSPSNPIFGYGSDSSIDSVTYTPVSGIFPAQIDYDKEQKIAELDITKEVINKGQVRIKVEQNARDFIEDGRKTERLEFDSKVYNLFSSDRVLNYLGLKYYIYKLENTN